ncbi:MAG: XrtA-associated tyrosine autokinase [Burkholderiales bacterium]
MSIIEKAFDKLSTPLPASKPSGRSAAENNERTATPAVPKNDTTASFSEADATPVQSSAASATATARLAESHAEPVAITAAVSSWPHTEQPASNDIDEPFPADPRPENGIPIHINLDRLRSLNIITPHGKYSSTADEFRMIKRPLLNKALDENITHGNLIMITSSLPGEGKTFCAINLAMSISMEMDKTVLLVDADVAKPSLMKNLGLDNDKKGLLDLLQDNTLGVSDVLMKTNVANLTVISAGQYVPHATELLASDAMAKLLEELAQRYHDRIILFDSPPLLVTTESSVLAKHMGQIVVVVEAERTPQSALQNALALIEFCNLTGVVLNKSQRMPILDYGYGYGYRYGQE